LALKTLVVSCALLLLFVAPAELLLFAAAPDPAYWRAADEGSLVDDVCSATAVAVRAASFTVDKTTQLGGSLKLSLGKYSITGRRLAH
jgi:hypothetical protein